MSKYIVDLCLDGYDTEIEREAAEAEFIYDQLNFTASSVKIKKFDDVQTRIEALEKEAVRLVGALKHQEGLGACVCAKGQSTVGANKLCNLCKALSDCPLAMKLIENKNG